MGDYLDTYSKFLIGNFNFFSEIVERLLSQPKVNKELILKVQRRLKVLKLIDSVSESLEKYFYGNDYTEILEHNVFDDLEYFVEYLLRYRKREVKINVNGTSHGILNKICSKSYESIHNYNCSDNVQININSDEVFLEDYDEIDELYFVLDEIASTNINFKIIDVQNNTEFFEDRINNRKFKNYVNTKITLLKISDYYNFIKKTDTNEFILNRMSLLDPNPIWKYYLLNIKIENEELPQTIINYASYVKDNYSKYAYLNEELYKFIGMNALMTLCEKYIEICDYKKFEESFEELKNIESNLLELIYLKAKNIIKNNDLKIDEFLREVEDELNKNPNKHSIMNATSKSLYSLMGKILEQKGDYLGAAQNYLESGELFEYINKLGQVVTDLNKAIYRNNQYSNGMILTSKIKSDYEFISDTSDVVDMSDIWGKDYTRLFTFELCAREIIQNKIAGEVAELGVFRGDFAKLLNEVFHDRKLYLFDTFESFDNRDVEEERKNRFMNESALIEVMEGLKNTNVELVMNKMKNKNNVIVKKGYFPESLGFLEEKFCFVSLDVDLYKPTLEGLKYFYERLSPGGYIFIHDYNHKLCPGVSAAVRDFEKMFGYKVCKFPISDQGGTLVITK